MPSNRRSTYTTTMPNPTAINSANYSAQLERLLNLDGELTRLRSAINGGTNVEKNIARVQEIARESAQIMEQSKSLLVLAVDTGTKVPTSGQSVDAPSPPNEKELLRQALVNYTTAGVRYWSSAATLWKVDARRGREICVLIGIDPDDRKPIRPALPVA